MSPNSIGRIIKTTENGPKDRCNIFNNLETKNKNFLNFRNENQNLSSLLNEIFVLVQQPVNEIVQSSYPHIFPKHINQDH